MKKIFATIGIAIVLFLFVFGTLGGGHEKKPSDEFSVAAIEQATQILESGSDTRTVKKITPRGDRIEEDAGEFVNDSVPYLWDRYMMLAQMQDFPWLTQRVRRDSLRILRAVPDSTRTELEKEAIEWMALFQKRHPEIPHLKELQQACFAAKNAYNEAVSCPVRVLSYDVRFKKDRRLYEAFFVSPVDDPKLKLLDIREVTLYSSM